MKDNGEPVSGQQKEQQTRSHRMTLPRRVEHP